jgi:acyl carrier protein
MNIDETLQRIFRRVMNDESLVLTEDMTAAEVEGWDSLSHVTLMFSIEQEFGIQFGGQEFAQLGNVGELRRLIERKTSLQS